MKANTRKRWGWVTAAALGATVTSSAFGAEIDTGTDLKIRWDNTVKYSAAARVASRSDKLLTNPNFDDGDRNFDRGLISNRFDLLSELDVTYGNVGARVSGAAWYDTIYNRGTGNDFPFTYNAVSAPYDSFTRDTRNLHGRKAELLDAFVFGKADVGEMNVKGRLGRHALLYGESLFFGSNGIAAAQSPIDAIKAISVPNTQFKELLRPVNQVSGQVQVNENVSVGAYYQFEWDRHRIPASGSYFSIADAVDKGGERVHAGPGGLSFYRGRDVEAKDSGQGGVQVRWRPDDVNTDFGFYAARYHDKFFQVYVEPGVGAGGAPGKIGEYRLVFPEAIQVYGASFSTTLGTANVAGEVSMRRNMPLVATGGSVLAGPGADNHSNPAYPVGNSLHANLSMIDAYGGNQIWEAANLIAEIAWNHRLNITKNPQALDPNSTRDAVSLRFVFEPTYFQVLNGLDISVPIGIGYTPYGRSSVVQGFGPEHGGDISIGINGDYLKTWKFSLSYTHYFGSAAPSVDPVSGLFTFKQTLRDRDFVALSLSRTF
ncbi:DUF1302 domain-containing protein [Azospirillum sp.]|uniref:DUF1302 domain-containing protein n=1 Tax=Azospirillum sp. TaxID=34012 RepID=UPI002D5942CF|nr:DUF1302 domain-containing protein [Azospirillum sp.]HYD71112.1 DUF1302 domain-containing protein [Azospirillum sp.]